METNLTVTELAVLGLLGDKARSGYELAQAAERSIGHFWSPARSHIYRVLPHLAGAGFVKGRAVAQASRPDKRVYSMTVAGRRALRDWLETVDREPQDTGEVLLKIFFGATVGPVVTAAQIGSYRAVVRNRLDSYLRIDDALHGSVEVEDIFAHLTLQHGIARARATIRWADASLVRLERAVVADPSRGFH